MLKKPTSRIVGAASKAKTPTPSASLKQRPALPFFPSTILLSRVQWKISQTILQPHKPKGQTKGTVLLMVFFCLWVPLGGG